MQRYDDKDLAYLTLLTRTRAGVMGDGAVAWTGSRGGGGDDGLKTELKTEIHRMDNIVTHFLRSKHWLNFIICIKCNVELNTT